MSGESKIATSVAAEVDQAISKLECIEIIEDNSDEREQTTPGGPATEVTSCQLDLRAAQKQWPLLKISLASGALVISGRSSTDVLAKAANKYTARFAKTQAHFLKFLVSGVIEPEHRDAKFKYLKSVLGADAGFISYLIISTLLAFTNNRLEDTLRHVLRRLNGANSRPSIRIPVSAEYRIEALDILEPIVKNPVIFEMPRETMVVPFLTDLVKVQEKKVKCWIRQADLMAESNPSIQH